MFILRCCRFAERRVSGCCCVDPARHGRLGRSMAEETDQTPELPDRLSLDPRSAYFDDEILRRGVGIRFNGQEKTNVEEYCVSEGWIRVAAGRSRDRYGNPMTLKLKGQVEPFIKPEYGEIGRASCRERVEISVAAVSLKR